MGHGGYNAPFHGMTVAPGGQGVKHRRGISNDGRVSAGWPDCSIVWDQMTDGHENEAEIARELELRRKRALYRAEHRGTKEMDWLLGRFAAARLGDMAAGELVQFEQLISIGDPELHHWLLEPEACRKTMFADLVSKIRRFHGME